MLAFHKAALFIDGLNLDFTAKALGFEIDFKRLLAEFARRGTLVRAYYYTSIIEDNASYSTTRPLTDWLTFNGFTVVTKAARESIRGKRTKMSPVSENDLAALMDLGFVEMREGIPRLTGLGGIVLE
ncbi:NYN domain-containing protein [Bradyrhizobium sp. AUGA SZCCT0283]|nr:NYN domain-containing protein [Bradyrhizobium sp. AUGA SZCCT0283]